MSHELRRSRATREIVRSSAEAALPPPDGGTDEPTIPRLSRILARILDELTAEPAVHSPPEGDPRPDSGSDTTCREDAIRLFRSILSSLSSTDEADLPMGRAGLGSTVRVRDLRSGDRTEYQIVPLELVDGSLERVTIPSPIGRGLLGRRSGDTVELVTPSVTRTVRVEDVGTLWDQLDRWSGATLAWPPV